MIEAESCRLDSWTKRIQWIGRERMNVGVYISIQDLNYEFDRAIDKIFILRGGEGGND